MVIEKLLIRYAFIKGLMKVITRSYSAFIVEDCDDYALLQEDYSDITDKTSTVSLCWNYYTEGRTKQIIDDITKALDSCESVEIWRI